MEIRLHGRGGQGGVTCAKILAAVYARYGKSVQAFGDYASERSGAPVRAYMRVSDDPILNRNKVYTPDHLIVLDPSLLGGATVDGLALGGTLLVNSAESPEVYAAQFPGFRVATVDATRIARAHGIGSRSVVIVNTTIAGAFAKLMDLELDRLREAYEGQGLGSNFPAAEEAFAAVRVAVPRVQMAADPAAADAKATAVRVPHVPVVPLVEHTEGRPTGLQTGAWRSLTPRYIDRLAPCSARCPAGNDVIGFVQAAARQDLATAAEILAETSPFPGICGRVCPGFCMQGCNRTDYDGAVNTRGVERWIADHTDPPPPQAVRAPDPKRIAIVGGGPAGLSAAYQIARAGHAATVFDKETRLGGVLLTGIPEFRLPADVLDAEVARVLALGVETELGRVITAERVASLAEEYDAVILATGLQALRGLGIPGAELDAVSQGIRFLERRAHGLVQTAPGHVVVLCGGNTAVDCARTALRTGSCPVTIAYRRTREEMPALAEEVREAEEEGVRLLFQRSPVSILGEKRARGIVLAEVEMGEPDSGGRRRPLVTDRTEEIPCDGVLLALGQSADRTLLPRGWELRFGQAFRGLEALPVFAAGDLSTYDGTVVHAIGDGNRAARQALRTLGVDVPAFARPDLAQAVTPDEMRLDYFDEVRPTAERHLPEGERLASFAEVNAGLTSIDEAQRCLSCGDCTHCDSCLVYCPEGIIYRDNGAYRIDYDFCKGCGVCVTECPRCGMEMVTP